MLKDYFTIPLREIRRRKLRSVLTLLGVIIGIAAVISLITLGQGLQNAISDQFAALGTDKLFISAKGSALTAGLSIDAVKITNKDLDVVRGTSGIKKTAGFIWSTSRIEFNNNVRYFIVSGLPVDPEERALIGEAQSYTIEKGRSLRKGDTFRVILGHEYTKRTLFGQRIDLGDLITIQDRSFKVVGFLAKIGSPPDDQSVMIPLETYSKIFDTGEELGMIIAQTQPGEDPNQIALTVEKDLRKSRGLSEGNEDFSIQTPEKFAEAFTTILDIVQIVLIGIAAISLLVGGVGIMNTMYTSVLERTKEIGVLKALGAQNSHILYLFLVESGLYGLGGGLMGMVLGISFAKMVELVFFLFIGPAFLSVKISPLLIVGTLLFSFTVGCLSGVAPARRASKLKPVDSLRYE